jgi:hypothetical protein
VGNVEDKHAEMQLFEQVPLELKEWYTSKSAASVFANHYSVDGKIESIPFWLPSNH